MRDQGQGHIRQRGPQSWELKFDLGHDPASGKRLSRYVTFKGTKREAQAELNRLLSRKAEGTYERNPHAKWHTSAQKRPPTPCADILYFIYIMILNPKPQSSWSATKDQINIE
jgi:hypothetical protein